MTILALLPAFAYGQQMKQYSLAALLQKGLLETNAAQETKIIPAFNQEAVTTKGIAWLKQVSFKEGLIDIDLRGKNIFLQSFLGIAFYATDTVHYEVVYFRPFNFHHTDTARRRWSVQYMCLPEFDYDTLRKAYPLKYENSVTPVPDPDEWFHATIKVSADTITVYVNHAVIPSLSIKRLSTVSEGSLGLWTSGLSGDFAHLSITPLIE